MNNHWRVRICPPRCGLTLVRFFVPKGTALRSCTCQHSLGYSQKSVQSADEERSTIKAAFNLLDGNRSTCIRGKTNEKTYHRSDRSSFNTEGNIIKQRLCVSKHRRQGGSHLV